VNWRNRRVPHVYSNCGGFSRVIATHAVANGRILASLIPDARLETIEDGHMFLVTSAERAAGLISEFLT
jgi:hypothetical protein